MMASASWQNIVAAPVPGQHIAQLYTDEAFLARAVGDFIGQGLRAGDAGVILAVPSHWQAIAGRLESQGFDLEARQRSGQLLVMEAAACLARVLVDGIPDRERFRAVVGGAVETAGAGGARRVRAFGELVDLLRRRSVEATIRLEDLWNELLAEHRVSLLCGYCVDAFDPHVYRELLQRVCAVHSDLIPVDDYAGLEQAVERAYREIFGTAGDADALRRVLLSHYRRPAAMPDAAAALLAVREYVPTTMNALLQTARRHYRQSAVGGAD
jgi:hypothetical protein